MHTVHDEVQEQTIARLKRLGGHMLGKQRTRMRARRQKKQIFIYTNRRVLAGYKNDLAAECDSASENSESTDEDTPLIDLRGRCACVGGRSLRVRVGRWVLGLTNPISSKQITRGLPKGSGLRIRVLVGLH